MAERPVFIPVWGSQELVKEIFFSLTWNPGFAPVQKKKNVMALHEAAARAGWTSLLEISSKSEEKLGQHLSAFHLKVRVENLGEIKLECAFQGSKVFEREGRTPTFTSSIRRMRSVIRAFRNRDASRASGLMTFRSRWNPRPFSTTGFTLTRSIRIANGLSDFTSMRDSRTLSSIRASR